MARLAMNECIRRKEFDTLCCSEAVLSFQLARESYQTILDICWTPHLYTIYRNKSLSFITFIKVLIFICYWSYTLQAHKISIRTTAFFVDSSNLATGVPS